MFFKEGIAASAAAGIVALMSVAGTANAGASPTTVYSNDFESAAVGNWSNSKTSVTPTGRGYLGDFGNDTVNLPLANLPGHTSITLSFDLYIIRSWDGNISTPGVGPDIWSCGMTHPDMGEHVFLGTTFSNQPAAWNRSQSYPLAYGDGDSPMYAGAMEVNSLGYTHREFSLSSVYHMEFTMPEHTDSSANFWFRATGLQGLADESWGLDNVNVTVSGVPAPGALALLGLGGLVMGRRRR
jgi:MYXO-CTERM domain-containing protein